MRQLTASELKDYLASKHPPPVLIDVRESWEYEIAHLSGAVLIPLSEIPAKIGVLDPRQETVVMCHHGIRSYRTVRFLEQNGFSRVYNLRGGIDAWAREVDPRLPVY